MPHSARRARGPDGELQRRAVLQVGEALAEERIVQVLAPDAHPGATIGAVVFLAVVYPVAHLRRGRVAPQTELALGEGSDELALPLVPFGVFLAPAAVIMLFFGDELLARVFLAR